ncbi:MAG TPA: isocitrate/isopropylmalate family dehydrogenase [Pseudonocardiaceae bacterium]|nr:isocitrate/isopropylmalate family dehydrogenase [Pseudonocardiaceae bacterium]
MAAALVPGDGIGPEVTSAAVEILRAAGADIEWHVLPGGADSYRETGDAMPASTVATVHELGLALKGPLEVPLRAYENPNKGLRHAISAYANVRTVQGHRRPFRLAIVRELTEDSARGAAQRTGDGQTGIAVKVVTRTASEKVARFAYDWATAQGLPGVAVAHLGPSQRDTDGLFLDVAMEVARDYPALTVTEEAVDPLCVHLIQNPLPYHVILTMNVYGGILCGVAAGLAGSVGLMPGMNVGETGVVFEAGHGSAPRHAGKDTANPMGLVLSGAMLLDHVGQRDVADRVRASIGRVVAEGTSAPRDLGGSGSLSAFVARVEELL